VLLGLEADEMLQLDLFREGLSKPVSNLIRLAKSDWLRNAEASMKAADQAPSFYRCHPRLSRSQLFSYQIARSTNLDEEPPKCH
jgi:hypothetical protein